MVFIALAPALSDRTARGSEVLSIVSWKALHNPGPEERTFLGMLRAGEDDPLRNRGPHTEPDPLPKYGILNLYSIVWARIVDQYDVPFYGIGVEYEFPLVCRAPGPSSSFPHSVEIEITLAGGGGYLTTNDGDSGHVRIGSKVHGGSAGLRGFIGLFITWARVDLWWDEPTANDRWYTNSESWGITPLAGLEYRLAGVLGLGVFVGADLFFSPFQGMNQMGVPMRSRRSHWIGFHLQVAF
jgi:hypothetical protein